MEEFHVKPGMIIGIIAAIVLCIYAMIGCNRVTPTEVGFKISNAGDYRGIDSLPTVTGYVFTAPGFSYIVKMPTTQQHVEWVDAQEIAVSCMGGAGFKMDIGFNYRVNPYLASKIYLKYRTDDLERITQTYLRNVVRGTMQDLSGTMTVDSILNHLPYYEHTVADALKDRLGHEGFIVDNFNIQKQPIPTDDNLAKSINAKIKAKQDAETSIMQLQQTTAEANKKIAEARGDSASTIIRAQAKAKEIQLSTAVLSTSPQYIDLIKAQNWNGVLPTTILGGNAGTLFNLK